MGLCKRCSPKLVICNTHTFQNNIAKAICNLALCVVSLMRITQVYFSIHFSKPDLGVTFSCKLFLFLKVIPTDVPERTDAAYQREVEAEGREEAVQMMWVLSFLPHSEVRPDASSLSDLPPPLPLQVSINSQSPSWDQMAPGVWEGHGSTKVSFMLCMPSIGSQPLWLLSLSRMSETTLT